MRLPALKVSVKDILSGEMKKQPGEWGVSYVQNPNGVSISRASIIGWIVDIFPAENHTTLTLDDTTGVIRIRFFNEDASIADKVEMGDLVEVIGKVREYQGEKHLVGETAVVLDNINWWLLRKAEIALFQKRTELWFKKNAKLSGELKPEELKQRLKEEGVASWYIDGLMENWDTTMDEVPKADESAKKKVLSIIPADDMITYTDIINDSGLESDIIDEALQELITEGEIFEPRSGKFKRL